jgi:hypothetical protein
MLLADLGAEVTRIERPTSGGFAWGASPVVPCTGEIRPVGRAEPLDVPPAELAVIVHHGPLAGIDRAYGALATHVTQHAIAVDGPVREYYLSGRHDTPDESDWRTEIGWPIFQTAPE